MSQEAYLRFRDAVMQSASLQAELVDTVKSQADLLAMGRRLGFEFDAADLESRQLAEEELRRVAGGVTASLSDMKVWTPVGIQEKGWSDVSMFDAFVRTFPR
jgi:predicted ribosomally synthesized peptide with nif11-like leader